MPSGICATASRSFFIVASICSSCASFFPWGESTKLVQAGCFSMRSRTARCGNLSKASRRFALATKKSTSRGASAATSASRSDSSGLKKSVANAP
jgi:hypothetical protein